MKNNAMQSLIIVCVCVHAPIGSTLNYLAFVSRSNDDYCFLGCLCHCFWAAALRCRPGAGLVF